MNTTLVQHIRNLEIARTINPPFILREVCRFCGEKLYPSDGLRTRADGDLYAHERCYKRENP